MYAQVDHTVEEQVKWFFERVKGEAGRLDILVNDIWGGDAVSEWGNLFYDLAKISAIRLAYAMSRELRDANITALALTPGFLRSEEMLDHFGVTEENWRDGAQKDPHFIVSETPFYIGRAVAALAADPNVKAKAGTAVATWRLAKEYGFTDMDGTQPDWGTYYEETVVPTLDWL